MDLSIGKILGDNYFNPSKLPNESDLPSSPSPYPSASNLDDQEPSLQQAVTCSQTEPDFWTMWDERWDLFDPLLSTENERWDLFDPLLSTKVESTANRIKPLLVKNEEPERWSVTELEAPNFLLNREVNQIIGGTIPTSFQEILPTESVTRIAPDSHCSYEKAEWLVNQKGIKTREEYRKSLQKELKGEGLPYNPDRYYSEWNGWDIFFRNREICPFEKARKIVQKEGIRTLKEYHSVWEGKLESEGLPYNPHKSKFYKDEWTNMYDFFGKVSGRKGELSGEREICPFEKARKIVQKEGIRTLKEYHSVWEEKLESEGLPYSPHTSKFYKDKWTNTYDFFGKVKGQKRG